MIGSGLDVWEIIQMLEDFGSIESLVEQTQLSERQVHLAVAYRNSYPEEIAEAIAENRRTAEQWREIASAFWADRKAEAARRSARRSRSTRAQRSVRPAGYFPPDVLEESAIPDLGGPTWAECAQAVEG